MRSRIFFLSTILLVLSAGFAHAGWIALDPAFSGQPLSTVINSQGEAGVSFRVNLKGIEGLSISTPEGAFGVVRLDDSAYTEIVGSPKIPVFRRLIEIPEGASVEVRATGTAETRTVFDLTGADELMPVQAPVEKKPGALAAAPFAYDGAAYARDGMFFRSAASVGAIGHLRGHRMAMIEARPVNYNPATGEVTIVRDMAVEVTFRGGDLDETKALHARYADPRTDAIFARLAINRLFPAEKFEQPGAPCTYLVIGRQDFFDMPDFQNFAAWKTQKGYDVEFLTTEQAGGTPENIRNTIINAYLTWDRPPAYVLLLGDTDAVPNIVGFQQDHPATDVYYAFMDTNDYFPDMAIGRFSARQPAEISNMVGKTLANELMNFDATGWIKDATFMASQDNHQISEGTHDWVIGQFMAPGDYTSTKLYSFSGATTQQALTSIDAGLSLLTYSGHGDVAYWADGPVVHQDDVRALTNAYHPMVFSFACLTGRYQDNESFSETWLRVPNGAVAMLASSVTSYWDQDDILERDIYTGFFTGGDTGRALYRASGMIDFGKVGVFLYYNGDNDSKRYMEMYNLFGDPEQMILTDVPVPADVSYSGSLEAVGSDLRFHVANGPYAMLGLTKNGEYLGTGFADAEGRGQAVISGSLADGDEVTATVTGHNLIPAVSVLTVGAPVDDDSDDDSADDTDNWHQDDDATDDAGDDTATTDDDSAPGGTDDDAQADKSDSSSGSSSSGGSCGC